MSAATARRVWIAVISVVVVAALVVAGVLLYPKFFGTPAEADGGQQSTGSSAARTTAPSVADPKVPVAKMQIARMTKPAKAPTPAGVVARLTGVLANPKLEQFSGIVLDGLTGKVLWSKDPGVPQLPASTNKLLTGAALLTSVDANSRLVTKVVSGDQPGDIVLVGGGDVTLSARTANTPTVYPGAANMSDLVDQLNAKNIKVTRIILDTDYWSGPDLAQGWDEADIANGYITRMSPLMVDGDREDPSNPRSPRTGDPTMNAGRALARLLGKPTLPLVEGPAPAKAKLLAEVRSQPISILLSQALLNSDNVLAEALARQAAIGRGAPPSFDGVTAAVLDALTRELKIDTSGVQVVDGSGLSTDDKVPPEVLARILASATSGAVPAMRALLTGLPVAGVSGTLAQDAGRFTQPAAKDGLGWVRAKTGSVNVTYALAGYVPTVDGQIIVFAVNSNGVDNNATTGTRPAQDAFAAALRGCGCP